MFTTTGGRQIFVKEVLGGAYDSQAEHFLRGDVDVDVEAIGHEATIVNDHVRMYFGPFSALLRIPLISFTQRDTGNGREFQDFARAPSLCLPLPAWCAWPCVRPRFHRARVTGSATRA